MAVRQGEFVGTNSYFLNSLSSTQANSITYEGYISNTLSVVRSNLQYIDSYIFNSLLKFIVYTQIPNSYYLLYKSRLSRFFGEGFRQTLTHIHINKSAIGLRQISENTAESVLAALILRIAAEESNTLISIVYIYLYKQYIETGTVPKIINNLVIHLYKKISYTVEDSEILNNLMDNYDTVVNPDNYNM